MKLILWVLKPTGRPRYPVKIYLSARKQPKENGFRKREIFMRLHRGICEYTAFKSWSEAAAAEAEILFWKIR